MRLKDKVAIITGGSRGIGYATAEAFLREGAKVIITASSPETAGRAVEQLKAQYPDSVVAGISPDLSDMASVRAAFRDAVTRYGCVDILVNHNCHQPVCWENSRVATVVSKEQQKGTG